MPERQYFYLQIKTAILKSKYLLGCLFLLLLSIAAKAQSEHDTFRRKGIQVSLLTCGTGQEIYSVFGHTAVRIVDTSAGTDIVYNYGTFDGYDKDFEKKFMQGKLLYYLSEEQYQDFVSLYREDGRWVEEQVINTSEAEKRQIQDFLLRNLLPEYRAYKYDFFFDNCATRIRDIFTQTHGEAFKYPNVLPPGQRLTFRDIINRYLAGNPWERFGINILLGSKIDKPMSNAEIMFLPDYLRDGVAGATLNGKAFANKTVEIVAAQKNENEQSAGNLIERNSVDLVLWGLLILLVAGIFVPQLRLLGAFLSNFMLVMSALLGILILVMWFGTDHQTCANNYNLLWALPTNLMFVFKKKQFRYAMIGIILILASLAMHLSQIQCLLLPEMVPVLLMLLLVFASNFKKYKSLDDAKNTVKG